MLLLWSQGVVKLVLSGGTAVIDLLGTCPAPGFVNSIPPASPLTFLWLSALAACRPRSVVQGSVCMLQHCTEALPMGCQGLHCGPIYGLLRVALSCDL